MGTVLVRHDPGCKWGRFEGTVSERAEILTGEVRPGHSDAAKRFSDAYNLHRAAGTTRGWIAVAYADGQGGADVYDTRADAVRHMWPREKRYFYADLRAAPSMSVCAAESVLRWKRIMSEIEEPDSGMEVIPRLAAEDQEAQIRAVRTGKGALALGRRK